LPSLSSHDAETIHSNPHRWFRVIIGAGGHLSYEKTTNAFNKVKNISLSIEKILIKIKKSNTGQKISTMSK